MSINFQFRQKCVVLTYASDEEREITHLNHAAAQEALRNEYSGELGFTGVRKIRKAIENFAQSIRYERYTVEGTEVDVNSKLKFITLTLPSKQMHSDKALHRLALNRFLITARRKFKMRNYLWRAETQKNGNLHYHILTDVYIYHVDLLKIWNEIMSDMGYIDAYRTNRLNFFKNGFAYSSKMLSIEQKTAEIKAYDRGMSSNFSSPNSSDIHDLQNIENVEGYIAKYMSKNEEGRGVWAAKWGCSDSLRNMQSFVYQSSVEVAAVILEDIAEQASKVIKEEFCTIFIFDKLHPAKLLGADFYNRYALHHKNQRKISQQYDTEHAQRIINFASPK